MTLSTPTSRITECQSRPAPVHATADDGLLRFLIAEFKTCAETGVRLTPADAVAIEAEDLATGKRATKLLCAAAFEDIWLPRLAAMPFVPDVIITVHDGRELTGARR